MSEEKKYEPTPIERELAVPNYRCQCCWYSCNASHSLGDDCHMKVVGRWSPLWDWRTYDLCQECHDMDSSGVIPDAEWKLFEVDRHACIDCNQTATIFFGGKQWCSHHWDIFKHFCKRCGVRRGYDGCSCP